MASTKSTGNKFETQCKELLENQDYMVIKSPRTMRCIGPNRWISADNDFWNLYDLCAKKKGTGETRWIQCKFGDLSNVSRVKPKIKEWVDEYGNQCETFEIWNRQPYKKEITIYEYDRETKEWNKR